MFVNASRSSGEESTKRHVQRFSPRNVDIDNPLAIAKKSGIKQKTRLMSNRDQRIIESQNPYPYHHFNTFPFKSKPAQ